MSAPRQADAKRRRAPRSGGHRLREPAVTGAPAASASSPWTRIPLIDALRGVAICLMIVYHFSFDLRYYGVTASDFEHDPVWLGFRAVIVAGFMTLVGMSLVLADRAGASRAHFWRRIALIAACALAASVGSWVLFPQTYIYFGILHCIAVASILAQPFVRRPGIALAIGAALIASALAWSHPAFDARALSWIGFGTTKPPTEDYVPIAPWAGFVFAGIALARMCHDTPQEGGIGTLGRPGGAPASIACTFAAKRQPPALLAWLGRHSLAIYMVHQPLLLAALWVALGR